LTVPASLKRAGREMRMLVENAGDQTSPDPSLLRILARAHQIQARLSQNPKLTVSGRAGVGGLPLHPPAASLAGARHHHGHHQLGRKPPQLTAQTLMRLTPRLPANWAEQRKLLGFH
jgi:site-specific DNA recombinase